MGSRTAEAMDGNDRATVGVLPHGGGAAWIRRAPARGRSGMGTACCRTAGGGRWALRRGRRRPFCKKAWRKTFRLRCGGVFSSRFPSARDAESSVQVRPQEGAEVSARPPPPRAGRRARKAARNPGAEERRARREVAGVTPGCAKGRVRVRLALPIRAGHAGQRRPLYRFAGCNATVRDRVATGGCRAGAQRHRVGALRRGGRAKRRAIPARGLRPFWKKAWRKTYKIRCGGEGPQKGRL